MVFQIPHHYAQPTNFHSYGVLFVSKSMLLGVQRLTRVVLVQPHEILIGRIELHVLAETHRGGL